MSDVFVEEVITTLQITASGGMAAYLGYKIVLEFAHRLRQREAVN